MAQPQHDQSDRLDSWKSIADYLSRDVATVRRWEKGLGLPVRRMPGGGPGHSVYAYVSEIEAWLRARSIAAESAPQTALPEAAAPAAPGPRRVVWYGIAGAAGLLLAVAGAALTRPAIDVATLKVQLRPEAVVAFDASGAERWRYPFPAGARVAPPHTRAEPTSLRGGPRPGVLVGIGQWFENDHEREQGGRLLWLTPDGQLERSFRFDDRWTFGGVAYGAPWVVTDFRIEERGAEPRVAVSAHHNEWWPGLVTVLDARGHRTGTFVNPGWIEQVRWIPGRRLLASGFSNARDGGAVALLDADALDGQAPDGGADSFRCSPCAAGGPIRYVVFPRSEVNRASGSPLNRAILQLAGDRVTVRTDEAPTNDVVRADILYELSPSLEVIRASFSDRYWEVHHTLEAEGRLDHGRERCPDRDGPRAIEVWDPETGWRTVAIRHDIPHSGTSLASASRAQK